jgi:hypothetical protein
LIVVTISPGVLLFSCFVVIVPLTLEKWLSSLDLIKNLDEVTPFTD